MVASTPDTLSYVHRRSYCMSPTQASSVGVVFVVPAGSRPFWHVLFILYRIPYRLAINECVPGAL
jgi:hypothetical protein